MTNEEIIADIYQQLVNIYFTAKNVHWFSKTYGNHLLFDRIADGLLDHVDALIEVGLMKATDFKALPVVTTNDKPTANEQIALLYMQLKELLAALDSIKTIFAEPIANELNAISQDVQIKINLLTMVE